MPAKNRNLVIIAIIALVNALGYGIIIPLLYTYTRSFGLTDFQVGLLFSTFSVFQFLSTPVIGRLSDKFGRKPLLVISIAGTAVSFVMMAFAPSAIILFLARALDGITAGNIPVASAVISDTTEPKDRARGFGIIGASFGFGFVFGPAISAFTVGFGAWVPFVIAAAISVIAVLITVVFLPETNTHRREVASGRFIDFGRLIRAVSDKNLGTTLLVTLFYATAFTMYTYAFQPYAVRVLGLDAGEISATYTLFGLVGLISQGFIIPRIVRRFGDRQSLVAALSVAVFTFAGLGFIKSFTLFLAISVIHGLANGFVGPLVQSLLSKETDAKSQGSVLGLNASYNSIGMILGPMVGGILSGDAVWLPFATAAGIMAICTYFALEILRKPARRQSAFSGN